jgi:hypothetical protein
MGSSLFQRRPRGNLRRLLFFIEHVFLQVARFVKPRPKFCARGKSDCNCQQLPPTQIAIPACSRTKCYRFLLPVGVVRGFFKKSEEVSPLESLAAPQGFETRYADPEFSSLRKRENKENRATPSAKCGKCGKIRTAHAPKTGGGNR